MDKKNKLLVILLIMGLIAILIGSNLKVNGNQNAHYTLFTGLILEIGSVLGLILYNLSKIKSLLK